MLDREPPVFSPNSGGLSTNLLVGENHRKRSWMSLLFLGVLAFSLCFIGLVLGFIYGDSYGRKNAQYDNPALRDYYAGKCYDYWEKQFKQTLHSSFEEEANARKGQNQKIDEIFAKMQDMERALTEFTAGQTPVGAEAEKSAVATAKTPMPKKL